MMMSRSRLRFLRSPSSPPPPLPRINPPLSWLETMGSRQPVVMQEVLFPLWTSVLYLWLSQASGWLLGMFSCLGGSHGSTLKTSQAQPEALLTSTGEELALTPGARCSGKSHMLGAGIPVQSLGVLGEGNVTKWRIKAFCSTSRAFVPLCFISHQKASPGQPSKQSCECSPVWQLPDASSQAVTEDSGRADTVQETFSGVTEHQHCCKRTRSATGCWPRISNLPMCSTGVDPLGIDRRINSSLSAWSCISLSIWKHLVMSWPISVSPGWQEPQRMDTHYAVLTYATRDWAVMHGKSVFVNFSGWRITPVARLYSQAADNLPWCGRMGVRDTSEPAHGQTCFRPRPHLERLRRGVRHEKADLWIARLKSRAVD